MSALVASVVHEGDGIPTVFFHGFLGSPAMWSPIVPQSSSRAFPHALVRLPGHGPEPTMPDGTFDTVIDVLADALPFERQRLVGYSMGARVALGLLARHPARVIDAVLVGVDPGLRDRVAREARGAWDDAEADAIVRDGLGAFVAHWEALPLFATQRALARDVLDAQRRERLRHTPHGLAWAMRTLGLGRMPDLAARLGATHAPCMLVTGSLDAKFTAIAQANANETVRHVVVEGVGHNVVLEAPARFAELLRSIGTAP